MNRSRFRAVAPTLAVAAAVLMGSTTAATASVELSPGVVVTPDDVAQFDARWMGDAQPRLDLYEYALKNRQAWVQWGLIEDAVAMVRMYELTRDVKYLDHLRAIAVRTLRYRDDNHPGDDFPSGDNPNCMVCQPPFIDRQRGGVQHAWGSGLYSDFVVGGGLNPVDAVTSGDFAYPITALARLVAEGDASVQATYGADAVRFANAGIQTLQSFASQLGFHTTPTGFVEGTLNRPDIYPTSRQCQQAMDVAKEHLRLYPPLDETGDPSKDTIKYYNDQIATGKRYCDRADDYAGTPYAYNEAGAAMGAFVELWRALDSNFYRTSPYRSADAPLARALIPFMLARHQRFFMNRVRIRNDAAEGVRYEWNYNDDVPNPHVEDTAHANLYMQFVGVLHQSADRLGAVTAPAGEPISIDNGVVRRLANTFLQEIAQPEDIDAGGHIGCRVDGSYSCKYPDPWVYDSLTFGWVNLASVDPTVFRIVRDVALRTSVRPTDAEPNPPPRQNDLTIGNHSGLLANKRYARHVTDLDLMLLTDSRPAVGDPFGWVFASGDVQDVTYRGTDGHVYEIWHTADGRRGYTNLSAIAGAPRARGNPKGYEFPALGTHNVIYVGTDGHLHVLYWTTGSVGHDDLTLLSGAPAPAGDPFPYVSPQYGVQNVIYRGADGHLHELYWSTGAVGHSDLTRLSGAPAPAGDPHGYFITTEGLQNIVYRGVDGHLHGLYWTTGAVGHDDLTRLSGAPPPSGNPVAYVTPVGLQNVFFRGTDGHLHGLYWDAGAVGHDDLSNAVSGAPLPVGDPEAYFNPLDGTHHVIYRTSNGHLHELSWTTGAVGHVDLTTVTPTFAALGKPTGYVVAPDRTQHVIFRAGSRLIELTWDTPGAGTQSDLLPLPIPGLAGPTAFCRRNALGTALQVVIVNQGTGDAGPSTTRVTFTTAAGPASFLLNTASLGSLGQSTMLAVAFPPSCTSTVQNYCDFRIDADAEGSNTESDETNNSAAGSCPPFAT